MNGLIFYAVKVTDIVYVTILYFVFGFYIAKSVDSIINRVFGYTYLDDTIPVYKLIFECIVQIVFSLYLSMKIKNKVIDKLPFPLEGVAGFKHLHLKELIHNGGIAWGIGILLYEKSLILKLKMIKSRITS